MKTRMISAVTAVSMLAAGIGNLAVSADETAVTAATESTAVSETTETEETTDSGQTDTALSTVDSEHTAESVSGTDESTAVSMPDFLGDPYYDTGGNASLVKSEQIVFNTEEMQFIAVTTKDGHVFYVLINYSAENGEDNVYFLNRVDDYDLYALLYAGDEKYKNITPQQAAQAAEIANGRVRDADTPLATEPAESEDTGEEMPQAPATPQNPMRMNTVYLILGLIALAVMGAAAFFLTKKRKPKNPSVPEDTENEEDYDFYEPNEEEE